MDTYHIRCSLDGFINGLPLSENMTKREKSLVDSVIAALEKLMKYEEKKHGED
jgi:hypothetical protein